MKNLNKAMMSILLVLTLILGAMALAENAEVPTLEPVPEQAETPEEAPSDDAAPATDSTALQDAMNAYRSARQESRQAARKAALEEELKGYVEAGKLTQEQADLILKDYETRAQQRANARNDQFAYGGRGGRMNGGKGGRMDGNMGGGKGGRMNGGKGGRMGGCMMGGMNDPMMDGNAMPQSAVVDPEMNMPEMGTEGI